MIAASGYALVGAIVFIRLLLEMKDEAMVDGEKYTNGYVLFALFFCLVGWPFVFTSYYSRKLIKWLKKPAFKPMNPL